MPRKLTREEKKAKRKAKTERRRQRLVIRNAKARDKKKLKKALLKERIRQREIEKAKNRTFAEKRRQEELLRRKKQREIEKQRRDKRRQAAARVFRDSVRRHKEFTKCPYCGSHPQECASEDHLRVCRQKRLVELGWQRGGPSRYESYVPVTSVETMWEEDES